MSRVNPGCAHAVGIFFFLFFFFFTVAKNSPAKIQGPCRIVSSVCVISQFENEDNAAGTCIL